MSYRLHAARMFAIALLIAAGVMVLVNIAFACGDAPGDLSRLSNATEAEAISQLKQNHGVDVSRSPMQPMCGGIEFEVKDLDGSTLAWLEIDRVKIGGSLIFETERLLETPKEQLKALQNAAQVFHKDEQALEEDLGIHFYHPAAFALEARFPQKAKQALFATAEMCGPNENRGTWIASSRIFGTLLINTYEYIPGRTNYSADTVYRKGDLQKALFADGKLLQSYKERIANNRSWCGKNDEPEKWIKFGEKLKMLPSGSFD